MNALSAFTYDFKKTKFLGLPMEAAEPRGQGPQQDPQTRPPFLQVYCLHGHLRAVQVVWDPCVYRPLGGRKEGRQSQAGWS